jgi:hypothetical protein
MWVLGEMINESHMKAFQESEKEGHQVILDANQKK